LASRRPRSGAGTALVLPPHGRRGCPAEGRALRCRRPLQVRKQARRRSVTKKPRSTAQHSRTHATHTQHTTSIMSTWRTIREGADCLSPPAQACVQPQRLDQCRWRLGNAHSTGGARSTLDSLRAPRTTQPRRNRRCNGQSRRLISVNASVLITMMIYAS
jgi:hypothetical protein